MVSPRALTFPDHRVKNARCLRDIDLECSRNYEKEKEEENNTVHFSDVNSDERERDITPPRRDDNRGNATKASRICGICAYGNRDLSWKDVMNKP